MPTIDASYKDLCSLLGKKMGLEELKEALLYAKGEIDTVDRDSLKIDIKDSNRPDLWSTEGIARELRSRLGAEKGLPKYKIKKSGLKIMVDSKLRDIRPITAAAVIKNVDITEELLKQIIHLQDKIDSTFGRKRSLSSIGIYDFDRIKGNLKFIAADPNRTRFAPLGFEKEMTLREILKSHPKGKEYGHLLERHSRYPIIVDTQGNILSMTPIINSNYTGKVTTATKNIFIEDSGFNLERNMIAVACMSLAILERGGSLESVDIVFPNGRTVPTPDMTPKKTWVDPNFVRRYSGLNLTDSMICSLLERARYEVKSKSKDKIHLLYPSYRPDIMHQVDVVEDVVIGYGYNKMEPLESRIAVTGHMRHLETFSEKAAEIVVGLGFQEIVSYTLTSKKAEFENMSVQKFDAAEIENPISENWSILRTWLLPGLLEFLSKNRHVDYPQKIFEIGDVVSLDPRAETRTRDRRKLAVVITNSVVGYEDIASVLFAFMKALGTNYSLKRAAHPSLIHGRAADIIAGNQHIGFVGEVHPQVLNNWKLEKPVVGFELYLDALHV